MPDYTTGTETKTWFKVVQPTPCWRSDLYKALRRAEQEYALHHGAEADTDDAFEVLTGDDEIIIRFEIKEGH